VAVDLDTSAASMGNVSPEVTPTSGTSAPAV